jgi:hypothetical protein
MGPRVKQSAKDPHAVVNVALSAGDWIGAYRRSLLTRPTQGLTG